LVKGLGDLRMPQLLNLTIIINGRRIVKFFKMSVISIVLFSNIPLVSAADLERGQVLFRDPILGESNMEISCNSCHPAGEGLGAAAGRENLEEIINLCIKKDLNGIGIAPDGEEMANIIIYIKSLQGKVKISERIAGFDCLE
jgi:hypothetical protein